MKKLILILIAPFLFACESDDNTNLIEEISKDSFIGRWNLQGFDGNVLYEFTEDKRFTFYSVDGNFEDLDSMLSQGIMGNDWWFEDNQVSIDLNFGNMLTATPIFYCDFNVLELQDSESNETIMVLYKENYTLESCSEL